jgi:hypothetical protein
VPTKDEIKNFSTLVEEIADREGLGLMDAICYHCGEIGLEVEIAATLISPALKAKIKLEAQEHNLLKKTAKLPI